MSKTDKNLPAVASVSNNINLNLNQNDLIELAITEKVEQLEREIGLNAVAIEDMKTSYDKYLQGLVKEILIKKMSSSVGFKDLMIIAKQLGITPEFKCSYDNKGTEIGKYMKYRNYQSPEDFKNPIAYYKQQSEQKRFINTVIKSASGHYSLSKGPLHVSLSTEEVSFTPAETAKITKATDKLNQHWLTLLQDKHELGLQRLNFLYGEKKIKAQIIKASLKNTPEGRGILTMLEGATNIKLIS